MIYTAKITIADGSAHAFAAARTPAQWFQVVPDSNNAGTTWVGDSTVAVGTVGAPIPSAGQFFPPIGDSTYIDLAVLYYRGTANDILYIMYGRK